MLKATKRNIFFVLCCFSFVLIMVYSSCYMTETSCPVIFKRFKETLEMKSMFAQLVTSSNRNDWRIENSFVWSANETLFDEEDDNDELNENYGPNYQNQDYSYQQKYVKKNFTILVKKREYESFSNVDKNPSYIKLDKSRNQGIMRFKKISCEPLFPDVLLYNRIFKTGSTSIGEFLVNSSAMLNYFVKKATTEDWYNTGDSFPYPEIIENHTSNDSRVAFVAHFYFRKHMLINRTYTYINLLREPVRRIISHYKYMRVEKLRPEDRIRELKESGQWNESLETCVRKQHRGCEDNVMTRFLCGTPSFCKTGSEKALNRAKRNIRKYYSIIGVLEDIRSLLKILKLRLPTFFSPTAVQLTYQKQNTDKDYFKDISAKTMRMLRQRNKADIRLYKYVKKRLKAEKLACNLLK